LKSIPDDKEEFKHFIGEYGRKWYEDYGEKE